MLAIVLIGVFLLITVTAFIVSRKSEGQDRTYATGIASIALVIGVVVYLSNAIFSVEARTVGIVTEFGQATGTVNPGFNLLAPWAEVTEFPTSTQSLDLNGKDGDDEGKGVEVKFTGGGQGWVNLNVNWKVKGNDEAIKLWNAWKDFDKVTNQVVVPRVSSHAAVVAGAYAPKEATNSENNAKMAKAIKDKLNDELRGQGIEILDVNVRGVDVDEATQKRINSQAQKQTDIDNATLEQQRAGIDNTTKQENQDLLTPQALIDQCLKITNNWDVKKNGQLPSNWNCFTGQQLPLAVGVK